MKRGFTVSIVIIVVSLLLLLSLGFWVISKNNTVQNVKGSSVEGPYDKPGLSISIKSTYGGWDLSEYICKTYSECTDSLESGKRIDIVGGGQTQMYDVLISYDKSVTPYSFIKLFVRPSWSSQNRVFSITDLGDVPDTKTISLGSLNVAIVPLTSVAKDFYKSVSFSDN